MQRYVLYRPLDRTGWGNRVRGLELAYLISLATGRTLVVDNALVTEFFHSPSGDWTWSTHRRSMKGLTVQKLALHLAPDNWNQPEWDGYLSQDLNDLFPAPVIELNEGVSFADALVANPRYRDLWVSLGMNPDDKVHWVGVVTRQLLSRPTSLLLKAVNRLKSQMQWPSSPSSLVGIQYRTFFDIGSPWLGSFDAFRNQVLAAVQDQALGTTFFLTTDSRDATRQLALDLKDLGVVCYSDTPTLHTGSNQSGWLDRLGRRLTVWGLIPHPDALDLWRFVPKGWRRRPQTRVLAEWYLLGECSLVISTFTSFSVYAAARTGNRAQLLRFDQDTQRIGPITHDKYFF